MRIASLIFLTILSLAVLACTGRETVPTHDIQATVEAGIAKTKEAETSIESTVTARLEATRAAEPSPTQQPTPTFTPQPTLAPTVAPTATPRPEATATPTPLPTPTAIPSATEWKASGNWYRDTEYEQTLTEVLKETVPYEVDDVRVTTLDATPGSAETDLSFTLACLESAQVAYLTSYSFEIPENVNTYAFGIWDDTNGRYLENHEHLYYSPIITDDASGIYITNRAELRQILNTMTYAAEGLDPDQYLVAGMSESDNDADLDLWSEFDAVGIDDALQYLGCFSDTKTTRDTPLQISADLREYAARHAGGPGAIYVGDLNQLIGPAPTWEQGDDDGNVPLYAIEQAKWIFESEYYRSLLQKARLTNPTELVSKGEDIELQHTCINSQLFWCKHLQTYFVPNVEERTNGQVTIYITSFPELGIAGTDTATLLADGTLSMTEIYGGYVGGEFPADTDDR